MKKLINSVLFCLICLVAVAQEAEQIDLGSYGTLVFNTNTKTIEYYETQIKLWEKKVNQNKKDANAWYNYFAATKCAWELEVSYQMEKVKNGVGVDMKGSRFKYAEIAEEAYKQIPNTFEGNYMMHYRNNFFVKANYNYLLKAQELKPFDKRIIIDVFRYYELIQDLSNAKITATEVVKQKILSEIDYATAYNMLMELDDNAVLITNGYNEYLSCLVLQKVKNIKPNVLITTHFNINPVNSPTYDYTDKTLSRLGLKSIRYPEEDQSDNKNFNWEKLIKENEEIERKNYELVFNSKYPVYVSNNCINLFRDNFGDKLYLHGLTYRYSRKPENFIYTMKDNFEKNYVLDYLKHDYLIDLDTNLDCQNFLIYLPMSATLQTFYKEHNQPLDEIKTKKFIRDVCARCGIELAIETQDSPNNYPFIAAPIDLDKIDYLFPMYNQYSGIVKGPHEDYIRMGKYEVSNGEFKLFLDNLKQTKNYESYYKYYPDTMLWNKNFAQAFHDPMTNMYNYHPAYSNYPVVNITHEAAVAYCEWLTEQVNKQRELISQENPRKHFYYVRFRLPTEQEWRYAAGSKNEKAITPFPNDQILTNDPKSLGIKTDASSCYLGNIKFERKTVEKPQIIPKKDTLQFTDKKGVVDGVFISGKGKYSYHDDGGFHTIKVSSYYPNALGLYNTFGNVAEMTSTKGVIKGGSWDDVFDDCTFDKNSTLTAPDSRVGFRMIMEIMEDIQDLPTSKIAPNLGIDKKEITHFDWMEFLEYQKQYYGENSAEYRDNLPDTTLVKNGECEHYNSKLYNLPAYRDMPMIGITLKQAQNYSVWRTNRMFEFYLESNKYITRIENAPKGDFTVEKYYQNGLIDYKINTVEKYPFVPVFSIPSVEDYQQIKKLAIGNNTEKTNTKSMKMTFEVDSIALCNLNQINTFIVPEFKNIIYYLESGVAEWTSNENKVINGSVELNEQHKKGAVTDANQLKYIGFRNKVEWVRWNPNQTK